MPEDRILEREGFLGIVTWAIGGLISLGMGIPVISYIIGPSLQKPEGPTWIHPVSYTHLTLPTTPYV